MLVTFSGLDGAGKSTLIDPLGACLRRSGHRVRVRTMYDHIGVYAAVRSLARRSSPSAISESPVRTSGDGRMSVQRLRTGMLRIVRSPRAKQTVLWLDLIWFRLYLMYVVGLRREILLLDRYFYDSIVEAFPDIATSRTARGVARVVRRPDVALFIDVAPAVAFERKAEYSVPELERRVAQYREIFLLRPEIQMVANSDRHAARDAVWRAVASRLGEAVV